MIITIIQHELKQTFANAKNWYGFGILFAMMAMLFNWLLNGFLQDQIIAIHNINGITEAVVHPFYAWFALICLIMIPSITTQYICAEKAQRTIINYYLAPIKISTLFLGKLLTIAILLLLALTILSVIPMTIVLSGTLDWGHFAAINIGIYLMLLVAMAVGLSIATFMQNIIRSTFVIFCGIFAFIMLEWASQFVGRFGFLLQRYALLKPLKVFLGGIISPASVMYYLSIICVCILLGAWRLQYGRTHD